MDTTGNIYRSSTHHRKFSSRTHRSLSFNPDRDEGVSAIELLKARLIAERSTAESAKLKIEELENKVLHLERTLELEIQKRKNVEEALQESLEKMLDYTASGGEASTDTELESFVASEGGRNSGLIRQPGFDDLEALLRGEPAAETGSVQVPKHEPAEFILQPVQPTVHSDSEWATDGIKHEENSETEEEDFEHNRELLDLPRKMGSLLQAHTESRVDKMPSQAKEPWLSEVVHLIEDEISHNSIDMQVDETHQSTQIPEPEVPYVSFAKYLGLSELENVEKCVETDGEGTVWKINEVHADMETESLTPELKLHEQESTRAIDDVETVSLEFHRKKLKYNLLKLGVVKAEDNTELPHDRMDDLFKVLKSAKKKLKHSRERRQMIEKQLLAA